MTTAPIQPAQPAQSAQAAPPIQPAIAGTLQPLDDPVRRAQLAKMKRRATALLVVAAVVFVVARLLEARWPWLAAIRATAEAAMVGGLADWFAVTALFRHPLGIPIPHTAIIAERKNQIGRVLGNFVQKHFLSKEVLSQKLATLKVSEHLAKWLTVPENSALVAHHAANGLAAGVRTLKDEDVQALIDGVVARKVRETAVAPIIGKVLSMVTEGNRHQELLDQAIALLARGVHEHQDAIRDKIEEEAPWWVPNILEDKLHDKIVTGVDRTLREVRDDPEHPLRERFDQALTDFIVKLEYSPDVQARAEKLKLEIVNDDAIRRFSSAMWDETKEAIFRYVERQEDKAPGAIERGLVSLGNAMLADPALLKRVDDYVCDVAMYLLERYQGEVSQLIATTVAAWDPEVTSQRIELAVGRDLQYIRINGTLVGGLVGLLLFLIGKLI